jgi:hypothetical protein
LPLRVWRRSEGTAPAVEASRSCCSKPATSRIVTGNASCCSCMPDATPAQSQPGAVSSGHSLWTFCIVAATAAAAAGGCLHKPRAWQCNRTANHANTSPPWMPYMSCWRGCCGRHADAGRLLSQHLLPRGTVEIAVGAVTGVMTGLRTGGGAGRSSSHTVHPGEITTHKCPLHIAQRPPPQSQPVSTHPGSSPHRC